MWATSIAFCTLREPVAQWGQEAQGRVGVRSMFSGEGEREWSVRVMRDVVVARREERAPDSMPVSSSVLAGVAFFRACGLV